MNILNSMQISPPEVTPFLSNFMHTMHTHFKCSTSLLLTTWIDQKYSGHPHIIGQICWVFEATLHQIVIICNKKFLIFSLRMENFGKISKDHIKEQPILLYCNIAYHWILGISILSSDLWWQGFQKSFSKRISEAKYISENIFSRQKEYEWSSRPWKQVSMRRWKMVSAAHSKWPSHFVKIKPNVVFKPDILNLILLEREILRNSPFHCFLFLLCWQGWDFWSITHHTYRNTQMTQIDLVSWLLLGFKWYFRDVFWDRI